MAVEGKEEPVEVPEPVAAVQETEPGKTEITSNTVTTEKEEGGEEKTITFNCDKCTAVYNTPQNLLRHKQEIHNIT